MNKKLIGLITMISLCSTMLVGCQSPKEMLRNWLLEDEIKTENPPIPNIHYNGYGDDVTYSDSIEKAYKLAKDTSQANADAQEELLNGEGTVDFIKREDGIGFLIVLKEEYASQIINSDSASDIYSQLIEPNLKNSSDLKKQLDSNDFKDVNSFIRFESNEQVIIEIVNGELKTLNLANASVEKEIFEKVNPTATSKTNYGKCKNCGDSLTKEEYNAMKYYCYDCYGKIKEEEYKEKTKYGFCNDCGAALTSTSQQKCGLCNSCQKNHKQYGCDYCGGTFSHINTNKHGYSYLCDDCLNALDKESSGQYGTCKNCGKNLARNESSNYNNGYCNSCIQSMSEKGISHEKCSGCGNDIGLNGGEGLCHDCLLKKYNQ